ncbi:hypothetical protein ACFVHS_25930 [Streptomyces sp. NPDC057746]|uniref:hypothetical protein n=1 Tax=Streptomyces sp. NPDC057746 TaxID=3346237 RepID=UPI0036BECC07
MNVMLSATCAGRPAEAVRRLDTVHRAPVRDGEPGAGGRWCGPASVVGSEPRPEAFGLGGHRGASARHAARRPCSCGSEDAVAAPGRTGGPRTRPAPDAVRPAAVQHEEATG